MDETAYYVDLNCFDFKEGSGAPRKAAGGTISMWVMASSEESAIARATEYIQSNIASTVEINEIYEIDLGDSDPYISLRKREARRFLDEGLGVTDIYCWK